LINLKYICKVFDNLMLYIISQEATTSSIVLGSMTEGYFLNFLRHLMNWIELDKLGDQKFLNDTVNNVFIMLGYLTYQEARDFQSIYNS